MLLKLISCGSLALVSVLVVTLLQGLRQHNQRIQAPVSYTHLTLPTKA